MLARAGRAVNPAAGGKASPGNGARVSTPRGAGNEKGRGHLAPPSRPRQSFLLGTLAPRLRAFDRPMATACLRLVTFLPDLPLFSSPSLNSCIAWWTSSLALAPYFR